jgi:tetratricopeptide (TPR) repeat protein
MLDRRDEAEPIAEEASARLRDQGGLWGEWILAEISALAGDYEDASNRLRTLCQGLETQGMQGYLESYLAMLGRLLCQVSRFDEAEEYAERARALEEERLETSGEAESWYMWRQVLARVYAYRGDLADAERLAREAVALGDQNDSLDVQCVTRWDLAEVLVAASCADEAAAAFEQALERAERKKNLALAAQVRSRLDALELTSRTRAGD